MKIVATLLMTTAIGAGLTGAGGERSQAAPFHVRIEPTRIVAALNGLIQSKTLVGVSALVYENDREVYFGAFGAADRESAKPIRQGAVRACPGRIGSLILWSGLGEFAGQP
jgi:hypothetical protein